MQFAPEVGRLRKIVAEAVELDFRQHVAGVKDGLGQFFGLLLAVALQCCSELKNDEFVAFVNQPHKGLAERDSFRRVRTQLRLQEAVGAARDGGRQAVENRHFVGGVGIQPNQRWQYAVELDGVIGIVSG